MIAKLVLVSVVLSVLALVFYPRLIPWIMRKLGRSVGDAGRAGQEILTGEEVENSPLARYEVRAGEILAAKVLTEYPASNNVATQKVVERIGTALARHSKRREIPYSFTVVTSSEANAFAVAGGSVFVTEALVEMCEDENSLACVLGHEIVHIDARHALRNLAASAAVRGGIRLISLGRGAILSRIVGGMEGFLVNGYRQEQELEADLLGSRMARAAGYRPDGLVRLLERLKEKYPEGEGALAQALSYFRSHPPLTVRMAHLTREVRRHPPDTGAQSTR